MKFVKSDRPLRRVTAAAIIAASAGIAMLSPGDAAFGATFTFTTDFADMRDANAWTPNGIPGAADLAFFGRRAAGDNTNVDLTLNAGSIALGAMEYDTSRVRNIYNSDLANASTITLFGLPGRPLIQMNLGDNATIFGIRGAGTFLSGDGSTVVNAGSMNLVLATSGELRTTTSAQMFIGANIGEINGPQSLIKGGQGSLTLAGNNTFSGDFTVNTGSALLSGTNTIRNLLSASTSASVSCNITGGLSVLGSAEAHRGTLSFDASSNPTAKLASTASLIFSGGNVVQNGNATQNFSQTVNGAYVNSGQSVLRIDTSAAGAMNSTLNIGDFHRTTGAYLNINYATNGSGIPAVVTTTQNGPYGIIGNWLNVGNNDWGINDGAGNVIALPAANYAAKDDITTWAANDNVTSSTSFTGTLPSSLTIGSLRFNAGGSAQTVTIDGSSTLTIGSGGILITGNANATSTIAGGTLSSGAGEILVNTNSGKTLTISSVIQNSGATPLTLTKVGSGTITLSAANAFTGGAFLDTGTINVATFASAGQTSPLGANGAIVIGGPNSVRIIYTGAASTTPTTDRNFYLGDGTQTFQLTNAATLTLSGAIDGPGTLIKAGTSGALVVLGAKNFSGGVQVNPGLLAVDTLAPIGQPSGLGTGTDDPTVTLGNGTAGTLEFRGTANATTDHVLQLGLPGGSNGGSINLIETQPVTLNWNGDLLFNSGQPTSTSNNGASVTFATNPANFRPFRISAPVNGVINYNGDIGAGTAVYGSLIKIGAGMVVLGGKNSYQLGTTVTAGTLVTDSNFSNGTIASSASNNVVALSVAAGAIAVVAQRPANNDPAGTTAIPWNSSAATSGGLQFGQGSPVGGRLDLNNNAMLVYGAITPGDMSSIIRTYLKTGHDAGWGVGTSINGAIISTSAKTSPAAHKTALGYARASDLGLAVGSDFHGATIANSTDTVIAYTLEGDANLDGVVNALDFNAIATNFGLSNGAQTWVHGDINYDSSVNAADFTAMAANFGLTTPAPAPLLGTLVPEPSIAVAFGASLLLLRRHRARLTS